MDTKEFLKEYERMCQRHYRCTKCQRMEKDCPEIDDLEELFSDVEKWSKEHPFKTNGMRFLDDNREHIRTYHRWENGCKPYIEVHIEADWWDAEYKGGE